MPIEKCQEGKKPGFRWGSKGKCYTYTSGDEKSRSEAKIKALKQGMAANPEEFGMKGKKS